MPDTPQPPKRQVAPYTPPMADEARVRAARLAMFAQMAKEALDG